MRVLTLDSPPVVGGEYIAAAVGLLLSADTELRQRLGLGPESRVLLFGCEGATDPAAYEQIVGESSESAFLRQSQSA
jgi:diaminopropionate ammonia-lyase